MDLRGSEEQRLIYTMLKQLYPSFKVIYEAVLPNNMRFDCFVKQIGLVVELDGDQHHQYVEHFHKDYNGFLRQRFKDNKKDELANELGIKIVRIKQKECPKTKEELKAIIDSVPYPDAEYDYENIEKKPDREHLDKASHIRAERYRRFKNNKV